MARLLIADDSPMHARHDIDGMQASQLDAIAFCANAIDFLYRRLLHGLHEAGTEHFHQADHTLPDAWAMVDWIYRLDGLVDRCRGFPKESPAKVDYRNSSSLVENQRHAIQHLTGTIPELVESGRSPWGHLCWILAMRPTEEGERRAVVKCVSGSLRGARDPEFRIPALAFPRGPIDYLTLYSGDGEVELGLTGQHEALLRSIPALEAAVAVAEPNDRGILQLDL